jgi:hypothetical protein
MLGPLHWYWRPLFIWTCHSAILAIRPLRTLLHILSRCQMELGPDSWNLHLELRMQSLAFLRTRKTWRCGRSNFGTGRPEFRFYCCGCTTDWSLSAAARRTVGFHGAAPFHEDKRFILDWSTVLSLRKTVSAAMVGFIRVR